MTEVVFNPKSGNTKTGPIPVSMTDAKYCPDACSLKGNGCYAEMGHLGMHWRKVPERGMSWTRFCHAIAALADGQLWRHNQAGDLPGDGAELDADKLIALVEANDGKRGFTYTHYDPFTNAEAIAYANDNGFTVNMSAESLTQADAFMQLGIGPVVTILPPDQKLSVKTPEGNTVVVCPATYRDDVSCMTCQLCQRQRKTIVGFPAHGARKAKAHKVFILKTE